MRAAEAATETAAPREAKRRVLTKAVLRAAGILAVSQQQLGRILGVSAPTVSRMGKGAYALDPERKEWELAALFVRMFRSLDSIVGGRDEAARAWLKSRNEALEAVPADLITDVQGLVHVVQYLDAARGRI